LSPRQAALIKIAFFALFVLAAAGLYYVSKWCFLGLDTIFNSTLITLAVIFGLLLCITTVTSEGRDHRFPWYLYYPAYLILVASTFRGFFTWLAL